MANMLQQMPGTTTPKLPKPQAAQQGLVGAMPQTGTATFGGGMQYAQAGNGGTTQAPPMAQPMASGIDGVGVGNYSATNNLMGSTVMPQDSQRLVGYNGMVDTAAQNVSNFGYTPFQAQGPFSSSAQEVQGRTAGQTDMSQAMGYLNQAGQQGAYGSAGANSLLGMTGDGGGGGGGFSYGGPQADVANARAQTMQSLTDAMTGPDRTKLAQDAFILMRDQSQTGFEQDQRQVAKRAGALGRVGAGMTTNDLTGLAQARDNSLNFASRDLALQAADKTLSDKIARTQLGQGVAQGFAGDDRGDASLNLQGAALGEQSAARRASNQLSAANSLMGYDMQGRELNRGLGNDTFNMGAQNTQERANDANRLTNTDISNRDFRYGADRDAFDRATNERDTARQDQYNQDDAGQRRLGTLSGLQNNQRAYEQGNRNEVRGERDYQTAMEDQSFQRGLQQQQFNEWLRDSGWQRTMQAGSMGYGNDPSGALNTAAGNAQSQANAAGQASANLMGSYFSRPRTQSAYSTTQP